MISAARMSRCIHVGLLCLVAAQLGGCDNNAHSWRFSGGSMGTRYHITVVPQRTVLSEEYARLRKAIATTLHNLEQELSTYLPESDLSRFNRTPPGQWFGVGEHTATLATLSKELHHHSQGAFDAGIGALVALWGFGANNLSLEWQPPNVTQLDETRKRSGIRWLEVDLEQRALHKTKALHLDFSAIAKGYAVDQLAVLLTSHKLDHYLIELGGEIRVNGKNYGGKPWRVGIVAPTPYDPMSNQVYYSMELSTATAMATSGEYRSYVIIDGHRYSHTINPANGKPILHAWSSVTVVHRDAAHADAWATALNVMGHQKGVAFANQNNLAALFIVRDTQTQSLSHYSSKTFPHTEQQSNAHKL